MAAIDINALVAAQSIDENASKKWMAYTSDTGTLYAVKIDENIGVVEMTVIYSLNVGAAT